MQGGSLATAIAAPKGRDVLANLFARFIGAPKMEVAKSKAAMPEPLLIMVDFERGPSRSTGLAPFGEENAAVFEGRYLADS